MSLVTGVLQDVTCNRSAATRESLSSSSNSVATPFTLSHNVLQHSCNKPFKNLFFRPKKFILSSFMTDSAYKTDPSHPEVVCVVATYFVTYC